MNLASTSPAWTAPPSGDIAALADTLEEFAATHAPVVLASSLGVEDVLLGDLVVRRRLPVRIVTIDTGRLPAATLELLDRLDAHYGQPIDVVRPDPREVEAYVAAHGRDAFYESLALRQRCCKIRKVAPLERALAGARGWVTGRRRAQSETRAAIELIEPDPRFGRAKLNPLAEWSDADVWHYVRANGLPYNPLHDRGYPTVGCDPCTRAVRPNEHPRAGRWWWEQHSGQECGLHVAGEHDAQ